MNKALYKWASRQLKIVSQVDDGRLLNGEKNKTKQKNAAFSEAVKRLVGGVRCSAPYMAVCLRECLTSKRATQTVEAEYNCVNRANAIKRCCPKNKQTNKQTS